MNSIRREDIKRFLEQKGIASLRDLSAQFSDVSLMTIHRDLDFLEQQGQIVRMRGGAKYVGGSMEAEFSAREVENREAKEAIAQKAVRFISSDSSIFFDAGTTTMALARLMPDINVSIVTSGPNIAIELAAKLNPTINVCGGTLNRGNMTLSGVAAMDMIQTMNIDIAFLAASGFTKEAGFTCGRDSEARIKKLVIEKARTVILLMDRSKVGKLLPFTFANPADIDYLVTNFLENDEITSFFSGYNVAII